MDELDFLVLCAEEQELASLSPFALDSGHPWHALPLGAQKVARLMQLQVLAEAAADALLMGQALAQPQEDALLQLWPTLLQLTAALPGAAADATPFAASACTVMLAQRPGALAGGKARHRVIYPMDAQALPKSDPPAATCTFELMRPATAAQDTELQVFAEQLNRAVEQCSKEVLEETLSELSRLPPASAVDLVRSSIEGSRSGSSALQLAASLRSRLLARASGSSQLDSPTSLSLMHSGTPPSE